MFFIRILFIISFTLVFSSSLQANLLKDAGFELGTPQAGESYTDTQNTPISAGSLWTRSTGTCDHWAGGPRSMIGSGAWGGLANGLPAVPTQGGSFVACGNWYKPVPERITQRVTSAIVGKEYTLSFWYANAGVEGATPLNSWVKAGLWVDGVAIGATNALSYLGAGNQVWKKASFSFVPTSSSFDFTIGLHSSDNNYGYVAFDGTEVVESVPTSTNQDFGDAPTIYPHVSHTLSTKLYLGTSLPDSETDQQSSADATGDGSDDNDGVTTLASLSVGDTSYSVPVNVMNKSNQVAYITAWIDFNNNGIFEFNEALNTNNLSVPHSTMPQTVNIVWDNNFSPNQFANLVAGKAIMRIRLTSSRILRCDSEHYSTGGSYADNYLVSPDGEVEDYQITINPKVQGIKGQFNVQRTNTGLNSKDYALYTQIVGRDFDYHVVFYDENMSSEKNLEKVPVKIDLIDANDISRTPFYTSYGYFSSSNVMSRVPVINPSDLDNVPATKEALFLITYASNADGSIVQQECLATDYKTCFENLINISDANQTHEAQDKFAIRPDNFFIRIADGDKERVNTLYPTPNISLASGYEYNLSFIATKFNTQIPAKGYERLFQNYFDFNNTGLSHCANTSAIAMAIDFKNGIYNHQTFSHDNVGNYGFNLQDDNSWTAIDQNAKDCIANSSATSKHFNVLSGCNIALVTKPIAVHYYPDHFDVNLSMQNLPSSGHDDFIYMSELNSSYNNVAIGFQGNIIAQSENNITTTNFTQGCVSTNVLLHLNASTVSQEGVNPSEIKTVNGTPINFTRYIRYNKDSNNSVVAINSTLTQISNTLQITKDKFLNEHNGTLYLDMRYNLNKHLTEPTNPVEVSFYDMQVRANDAKSEAHDTVNVISSPHIPKGKKEFLNNKKEFYFARVVSDLYNYPRVNMNLSNFIRTPLNVDIYCKSKITDYCKERGVLNNTSLASTSREQNGWYVSKNHNKDLDGFVTKLSGSSTDVTILPNKDITLQNGENGLVGKRFNNCNTPSVKITIETSPVLAFTPSEYIVNCTDNNSSQWTGVGKTGNVLDIKSKNHKTGKLEW